MGVSERTEVGSMGKEPAKRKHIGVSERLQEVLNAEKLSVMLGLDKVDNLDIQEAFKSLLNAQEILGASSDSLAEEAEGEMSF